MGAIRKGGLGFLLPLLAVGESGKHGAIVIKSVTLFRADGTSADKTPAEKILREEAHATNPAVEAAVSGAPVFGAGGGTGGADIYTLTVDDSTGFAAGDLVRSQADGRQGVYEIDTVPDGTHIKVFAATGEMDIQDTDTIETVLGEGIYRGTPGQAQVTYADLQAQQCELEIEFDALDANDRADKPAVSVGASPRVRQSFWPVVDPNSIEAI